ncbi:hypothetical protein RHQ60_004704 [Citrobacter amalonaticus]|nr:hypothetical protein [Citrobacter amalonaticus]
MSRMHCHLVALIVLCLPALMGHVYAAETTHVNIAPQVSVHNKILDGQILVQGQVSVGQVNEFVLLWGSGLKTDSSASRYVLTGSQDLKNKLHVRIESTDSGTSVKSSERGLVLDSGQGAALFRIVADGDQSVVADRYLLGINAAAMNQSEPEGGIPENATTKLVSFNANAGQSIRSELVSVLSVFPVNVSDNMKLARGIVSTVDASQQKMAVHFTDDKGEYHSRMSLSGNNNPQNKLKVKLHFDGESSVTETEGWVVNDIAAQQFSYTVNADGAQKVPVDSYTVSINAALWND